MHISVTVLVGSLMATPQVTFPPGTHGAHLVPASASTKASQGHTNGKQEATPTPMDQGKSESDRKITQRIRKALMDDASLSFAAKNVTIVTAKGKVTLRGRVDDARERDAVVAAARNVVGTAKVDNKLVIKK